MLYTVAMKKATIVLSLLLTVSVILTVIFITKARAEHHNYEAKLHDHRLACSVIREQSKTTQSVAGTSVTIDRGDSLLKRGNCE